MEKSLWKRLFDLSLRETGKMLNSRMMFLLHSPKVRFTRADHWATRIPCTWRPCCNYCFNCRV